MPSDQPTQEPAGSRTVLIVDDEPHVRRLTERMLIKSGYEVLQAGDGQEATDLFAQHRRAIDVVLLDVVMPVMTGQETLVRLRRIDPDLPVVFFSGYDRGEVAEHLTEEDPPTLFLPKPFTRRQLDERIRAALGPA